jgi:hypothetical protein
MAMMPFATIVGPQAGLQTVCTRVLARVLGVLARKWAYSHRVLARKGPCLQAEQMSFASRYIYRQYDEWILEPLRSELPAYVHYRNYIRGHQALGGKPSIAQLSEQDRCAPQEFLDRLESFARCEVKRKVVSRYGYVPLFGRIAYVGRGWREREVTFVETLEGLEACMEGRCVAVMRDYWKYRKLQTWEWALGRFW